MDGAAGGGVMNESAGCGIVRPELGSVARDGVKWRGGAGMERPPFDPVLLSRSTTVRARP